MKSNKEGTLMRLTASCEIAVSNLGRAGGCVALEITQAKAGGGNKVTTLLLRANTARELASVLLGHSEHVRDGRETEAGGEAHAPRELSEVAG